MRQLRDFMVDTHIGPLLIILAFIVYWLTPDPYRVALSLSLGVLGFIASAVRIWHDNYYGVWLTIFFLPLTKTMDLPLIGTKLAVPDLLFMLTISIFLVRGKFQPGKIKKRFSKDISLLALGSFLFFAMLSGLNAVSSLSWAVEVMSYSYLAVFFLFIVYVLDEKVKIEKAINIIVISTSIAILIGFIGYVMLITGMEGNPFIEYERVTSTFKAVNQLSISLLVFFFLLVSRADKALILNNPKSWKYPLISIIGVFVFMASGTRMVPFVLLPVLLIYILAKIFLLDRKRFPFFGVVLLLFAVMLLFIPMDFPKTNPIERAADSFKEITRSSLKEFPIILSEGSPSLSENNSGQGSLLKFIENIDEPRYHQVIAFTGIIRDYPLLGVGAGNFKHRMLEYTEYSKGFEMHNTFLNVLAETGIFGFLSLAAFVIILFLRSLTKRFQKNIQLKNYIYMVLLGLIANLMYTMVQFGLRNRHFWLGFALLAAMVKYENEIFD